MTRANVRRILVALDASPHSHAALQEAASLAAPLQAELAGVFVLDAELLRFSALPKAWETGLTSAQRRPMNPEIMERTLMLQAGRARKALEAAARHHNLQASFEIIRGNVLAELLRATAHTDLLAMGIVGQMNIMRPRLGSTVRGITTRAECSVLLQGPASRKGKSVALVYGHSVHADRALTLAAQLAAQRDATLVVLLCGDGDSFGKLEDSAKKQLQSTSAEATFETIGRTEFDALKSAIQRKDVGLLIMASDCELLEPNQDELCTLDLPILLAR
jgi:nucleotide-binding universal stress UspA family protein